MGFLKNLGDKLIYDPFVKVRTWVDDAIETQAERDAAKAAAELQALKDQADLDARLAAITRGDETINAITASRQEGDAWLMSLEGDFSSMESANMLSMGERTMARQLDARFEYDWDVPSESAFVLYNKELDRISAEEAERVAHIEDTNPESDRVDDYNQPADADDNKAGHTATDDVKPRAPDHTTAEDYYGAAGADPGEEGDEESFLEGWFDNLFSEPGNDPNDAMYNGDPDRSGGEKAAMIGGGALVGAILGLVVGGAGGDSVNTTGATSLLTVAGAVTGIVVANN